MKTNTQCLITGGAGFIGSHLCDELLIRGYEVYCIDNLITGNKQNIAHLSSNPKFHFILHDITQPFPSSITNHLSSIQYLYHLASPASPPQYKRYSIETLLVNSLGTYQMLKLAKETQAFFLLASTSEVYGNPLEHPQKETYFGNVNPAGVRACYDESKRFAEAITMEFVRKYKLAATIVRIFNTYGPRMQPDDGRVVSNFITAALSGQPLYLYGDGMQTRSFCYVADLVSGLIAAMENFAARGRIINLGNPQEKTIKRIGKIILKLTKSSSPLISSKKQEDDPVRRRPDITLAKKLLDWQPNISLITGLGKTIAYFRSL